MSMSNYHVRFVGNQNLPEQFCPGLTARAHLHTCDLAFLSKNIPVLRLASFQILA